MKQKVYQAVLAGHPMRFAFHNPSTRWFFPSGLHRAEGESFDVMASPERLNLARSLLPEDSAGYAEYRCLIELTALELLKYGCCIFHAASFIWHDRAWLLTAPSGVGKTTQFLNWQRMHPGEIEMISGDMPVLERRDDGSVWVHPSLWNGKERIAGNRCAPLAGIVLLEQGTKNILQRPSNRELILPLLQQMMCRPDTGEQAVALCALLDRMLRTAYVQKLVNLGDEASTELLRGALAAHGKELTGGSHGPL